MSNLFRILKGVTWFLALVIIAINLYFASTDVVRTYYVFIFFCSTILYFTNILRSFGKVRMCWHSKHFRKILQILRVEMIFGVEIRIWRANLVNFKRVYIIKSGGALPQVLTQKFNIRHYHLKPLQITSMDFVVRSKISNEISFIKIVKDVKFFNVSATFDLSYWFFFVLNYL